MPVLGCGAEMAKLMDVSDQDVAVIEDVIAERLALGVSQPVAQRQAVDEAIALLAEERAMVMAAVEEQLGVQQKETAPEVSEESPKQIAFSLKPKGSFGPVLTQYRHDAQGAIKALQELEDGEAVAALQHPAIGDIDLVWGEPGTGNKDGYGLSKIVAFHPEVLSDLQGIVNGMSVASRGKNRVRLESDTHEAAISLDWFGGAKTWLLTAYEVEQKENNGETGATMNTAGLSKVGDSPLATVVDESIDAPTPEVKDLPFANKPGNTTGTFIDRDATGRGRLSIPRRLQNTLPGALVIKMLDRVYLKSADPAVRDVLRGMKLDIQKSIDTAGAVAEEVNKLSADEREMVSDLIEGELKAGVIPPKHVVKLASVINQTFRAQTDELVRLDMMTQDASDRWRDKYIPRYYASKLRGSVDETWADLAGKLSHNRKFSQGIKGKHLMGRGMVNTIPVSELAEWEAEGREVRDKAYDPATSDEVHIWRDFTKEERVKMDEIRDSGFRFVMGYMQTQKDVALGRMYERFSLDKKYSSDNQKEGWVQVPITKVKGTSANMYGKLAGKWVPKNLMSQLYTESELDSDAFKLYKKALSWWKSNKTVMNPVSHMNNFVSNTTMAHFAGVSYYDGHKYAGAIKDLATSAPMVKEARDAGLFIGSFTDAELEKILPPDLRVLLGKIDGAGVKALKAVDAIMTFGMRNKMSQAYEFGDTFFKYLLYADARKNGSTPEEAVNHAQKYIFTYDDLPRGARWIRDRGLPFFAYTYKAIPVLADTALARPDRFFLPAGIIMLANAMAYAVAASDDDEDWLTIAKKYATDAEFRGKVEALKESEYSMLPEWMKGRSALATRKQIRLGTDEASGNPVFLDVSRFIPGGDLMDINSNAGGIPWLQPITPSNPLLSIYSAMFDNKDPFFGKDLVSKSDSSMEAAGKRADYLWKLATPAITIGNNLWDKAIGVGASMYGDELPFIPDAVGGGNSGLDRQGEPIQPKYTVPQMVGIKTRPIDLEKQQSYAESETQRLIRDLKTQKRSINKNNAYSDRLREKMIERIDTKVDRINEGLTVDGDTKD